MLLKLNKSDKFTQLGCTKHNCSHTNAFEEQNLSLYENRYFNYYVYLGLIIAAFAFSLFKCVLFFVLSMVSSKNLHKQMFNSVLSTSIRFFDINPLGNIFMFFIN